MHATPVPSSAALRAFEASARTLSFTRAAAELAVTQAAVSFQIRRLEEMLGSPLFARARDGLVLTPAGEEYLPVVATALGELANAASRIRRRGNDAVVSLTVFPSFAARWLMPRLGRFMMENPWLELRLDASNALSDLGGESLDLSIRFGMGSWPGVRAERLLAETIYPVASPVLLAAYADVDPAALPSGPLLEDETCDGRADGWPNWCRAFGLPEPERPRMTFSDSGLLIQAVVDGQGIALGRHALVADEIKAGRIARVGSRSLPSPHSYHLCWPRHRTGDRPAVRALRTWLLREAAAVTPAGGVASH